MTDTTAVTKVEKTVRHVWKSAQMYIAFHIDQNKRQRDERKFWPPMNGSPSVHGGPSEQEAIVVVKAASPENSPDVQITLHPSRIVVRRDAEFWWQGVAVDDHSITGRMADGQSLRFTIMVLSNTVPPKMKHMSKRMAAFSIGPNTLRQP